MDTKNGDELGDQFPIGLRVLAVDDDQTCLTALEKMLLQCKYQVTTSNQAVVALKILRENKNKFDLVIMDVHMPDMDGLKLLEQVRLEMDLPVIMLSANSDPKVVMKGISHGACDYLVKPVRIEALKNIWQHVLRRMERIDIVEDLHIMSNKRPIVGYDAKELKDTRKRQKHDDSESEEHDEMGSDNDDPSRQKKSRIAWGVELHGMFVSAVDQLGIDKAVPKKILELMNVETLTRENVASHLQKYRLHLKNQANQLAQATASGTTDFPYWGRKYRYGIANNYTFARPGELQGTVFKSITPNRIVGGFNTSAGPSMYGVTSSEIIQHNTSTSSSDQGIFQPSHGNYSRSLPSMLQMPIELDQLHNNQDVACIGKHQREVFSVHSGYPVANISAGSSTNTLLGYTRNSSMLNSFPSSNYFTTSSMALQFENTPFPLLSGYARARFNIPSQQVSCGHNDALGSSDDLYQSVVKDALALYGQNLNPKSSNVKDNIDFNFVGESVDANSLSKKHDEVQNGMIWTSSTANEGNLGQLKQNDSHVSTNGGGLEDIVSHLLKQDEEMNALRHPDFNEYFLETGF